MNLKIFILFIYGRIISFFVIIIFENILNILNKLKGFFSWEKLRIIKKTELFI